ncbi:hypothetical protein FJ251_03480 [bacterium]|nr:hypothetical protein [bacterium]
MRRPLGALLALLALAAPAAALETRPLLYSLLLPGLGEWSLGHRGRALTQFAVEAGCWAGNFYYRDRGFDLRHEYEAYAEAHWEEARWASAWNVAGQPDWMDWVSADEWAAFAWPDTLPSAMAFLRDGHEGYLESHFAPYQEDPQHYYENLGKYDWYRWGWDDYDTGRDDSAHRYVYLGMRRESNRAFDRAEAFIFAMVAARVVSLADTYILLRRLERAGDDQAAREEGWRLQFGPAGARPAGFRLVLTRSW